VLNGFAPSLSQLSVGGFFHINAKPLEGVGLNENQFPTDFLRPQPDRLTLLDRFDLLQSQVHQNPSYSIQKKGRSWLMLVVAFGNMVIGMLPCTNPTFPPALFQPAQPQARTRKQSEAIL